MRVDTGVAEGESVPAEFDSMIAKIIAYGQNRREALSRLRRVLQDSVVVIKGGASNKAFLLEMLDRSEVQDGKVDIAWLDRLAAAGDHLSLMHADVALVQAAIDRTTARPRRRDCVRSPTRPGRVEFGKISMKPRRVEKDKKASCRSTPATGTR